MMELEDTIAINASNAEVWRALTEAEVLQQAIPGCNALEGDTKQGFKASLTQKIGPIKANFEGTVTLSDIIEGKSYTINGSAAAGIAGSVKGAASVQLSESDSITTLHYQVTASISGKIAQLGNRLVQSVAKKSADKFFTEFKSIVENPQKENTHA